ncbi:hypothetical protein [Pseudomonas sp. FEN]|uniref:hypothetical protein n=1 Tax=Pseudomonas sp. FEN TaxID=2767468 RepID=UPI001748A20F|nr:hypothetical protein [Pseudomonas sp. FEN]
MYIHTLPVSTESRRDAASIVGRKGALPGTPSPRVGSFLKKLVLFYSSIQLMLTNSVCSGLHGALTLEWVTKVFLQSLEALIRLAQALHISLDDLVFAKGERGPSDDLRLRFEAVSHMPEAEKSVIKALLDGIDSQVSGIADYGNKQ